MQQNKCVMQLIYDSVLVACCVAPLHKEQLLQNGNLETHDNEWI